MSQQTQPMPCRGCLATCPNRATCQGKPWREDKATASTKH